MRKFLSLGLSFSMAAMLAACGTNATQGHSDRTSSQKKELL